jgi:hypothetical protein
MRKKKDKCLDQRTDFFSSFFPFFYFSFSYKTPKVPSTRVTHEAEYWHSYKELTLHRCIWDDNSRKTGSVGDEKENLTAKDRIKKCYTLCQHPKDEIKRCNVCWEEDFAKEYSDDDAWQIFSDHATFEEIVEPTFRSFMGKPLYELRELDHNIESDCLPRYPCIDSHIFGPKKCSHKSCPYGERISRCQLLSDYYKKWLQATRDNQDYLLPMKKDRGLDEAVQVLIRVLYAARWHMDKEEREAARELLIDNLIPDHKEHKTGLLPHYKILIPMRALLVRFATHLSKKCKTDYLKGEDLNDEAVFKELLIWAKENDLRIFNVASESKKAVMHLISKPAEYADSFLSRRYHISIRTLKDSLRSSVANMHSY